MTMIRTLLLSALTTATVSLGLTPVYAQSAEQQAETSAQTLTDPAAAQELTSEPGSMAILRGLDKVTARTRDFEAPIGEEVQFGALSITVAYCRKRPPEEPPEVYAFLEIEDRRTDGFGVQADGELMFSGWMFASNPALNALEHSVYDVWVIDCRS